MNTMFDKCAVAGDITQAIDRRGCWSVAICVIGGTESTAVKLQSCETVGGSFTDYKELIPASKAATDQYKGFVVDLYGAGKFIKVTGAVMATAVLGDCDHDIKNVAIKAGEVPSVSTLEDNKTATINVSTYSAPVEIEPSDDYDGMKKATVTLSNIPEPEELKLFAFGDAEGVVYLTEIPAADGTVTAYVPSTTGLEATEGAYAEATGVTISETAYARYTDGDITF